MKYAESIIGAMCGAVALNLFHETVKRFDHDAPRVDLIGEEDINKGLASVNMQPLKGNKLFTATLIGDLLSNGLYYSFIGFGDKEYMLFRGVGYGLAAGFSALLFTKPLGLSDAPVTRSVKTKFMTVSWYLFGGLVSAVTIKALQNNNR